MFAQRLAFIAVLILLPSLALGQDADMQEDSTLAIKAEVWALQFRIGNSFTLRDFQGSVLSAKRHTRDNRALRFGVLWSGNVRDTEISSMSESETIFTERPDLNTGAEAGQETIRETDDFMIGFEGQYLLYPDISKRSILYWGAGPAVSISRDLTTDTAVPEFEPPITAFSDRTEFEDTTLRAGVSGVIGVEWFASRRISLMAEYVSYLEYTFSKDERVTSSLRVSDTEFGERTLTTRSRSLAEDKGVVLRAAPVRFGLTIYL